MKKFSYEGDVHVRPLDRGVQLESSKSDLIWEIQRLVEAPLGTGWEGRLRIVVEKLDTDANG